MTVRLFEGDREALESLAGPREKLSAVVRRIVRQAIRANASRRGAPRPTAFGETPTQDVF